ncbi:MAG: Spy/CpxP family protein refolding chaperone [Candidatus Cloacimonetes bacterium]|nr:Spy/CpxP family protein refolding chaperone [Candidatus Cloacimonadota bacterium]
MKRIILTVVVMVALSGLLIAFNGDCDHLGRGEMHHREMQPEIRGNDFGEFGMLCEELELTDTQIDELEQLRVDHKKATIETHSQIAILHVDQKGAFKDHNFDAAKKLTVKIFELKKAQAIARIEHREAIWNELTPEQQEKAEELIRKRPHPKKMIQKKKMRK